MVVDDLLTTPEKMVLNLSVQAMRSCGLDISACEFVGLSASDFTPVFNKVIHALYALDRLRQKSRKTAVKRSRLNAPNKQCPKCGKEFYCVCADESAKLGYHDCWCRSFPTLRIIKEYSDVDHTCYCPDCLDALLEKQKKLFVNGNVFMEDDGLVAQDNDVSGKIKLDDDISELSDKTLTVGELIAELSKYDPNQKVYVDCNEEYYNCFIPAVRVNPIRGELGKSYLSIVASGGSV